MTHWCTLHVRVNYIYNIDYESAKLIWHLWLQTCVKEIRLTGVSFVVADEAFKPRLPFYSEIMKLYDNSWCSLMYHVLWSLWSVSLGLFKTVLFDSSACHVSQLARNNLVPPLTQTEGD